ncbi:hypothetical protein like AT2G15760 [Hibiscus trionum]|uniref:Calmodulin-binding protein n=1 Tax=Hibiscus trionum TaxID=183268 RepID=A0A9W7I3H9_HIBTR|nr:hypothetical protein like AT2G15760 [Hibiscus trionum]
MEVVVPVAAAAVEFNFASTYSSPYTTAPSSPQRFDSSFFFSAPTSPTHATSFAAVPFEWEEKPGVPKRKGFHGRFDKEDETSNDGGGDQREDSDFEFEFSGQLERTSLSAEELFDGGKIRPLKPPPGFSEFSSTVSCPKSRAFRKDDFDPFETAIEKSRKGSVLVEPKNIKPQSKERGRDRSSACSSSSSSNKYNYVHKKSRSLSPFRESDGTMFEQETSNPKSYVSSILSVISFSKGNRKWKLKDLLLFRSASEGRATSNDSFRKYAVLSKKDAEDVNNLSFRSTESVGSSSRRRGRVSAHELHYTANRAVSEEMRRKTFLPYKQGLLGCLGFNPGMREVSRGIVYLTH